MVASERVEVGGASWWAGRRMVWAAWMYSEDGDEFSFRENKAQQYFECRGNLS